MQGSVAKSLFSFWVLLENTRYVWFSLSGALSQTRLHYQQATYPSSANTRTSGVHSAVLSPTGVIIGGGLSRTIKGFEILLYLKANKLPCYSVMDAGRYMR